MTTRPCSGTTRSRSQSARTARIEIPRYNSGSYFRSVVAVRKDRED